MHGPPLRCTFEITFQEFREAVEAIRKSATRRQQTLQARQQVSSIAFVMAVASGVAVVLVLAFGPHADRFPNIRPPFYLLVTLIVPSALILLGTAMLTQAHRAKLIEPRNRPVRRLAGRLVSLSPYALLAGLLLAGWLPHVNDRDEETGRPAYDWFGTLFPHAAWALYFGIVFGAGARQSRRQIQQLWEQQPALTRPRIVEFMMDGLAIDEGVSWRRYRWPALVRLIETEHLLLACPSDVSFEIIPKRGFATPADAEAARALLQENIRDREAAPAFAVLAPSQPGPASGARAAGELSSDRPPL